MGGGDGRDIAVPSAGQVRGLDVTNGVLAGRGVEVDASGASAFSVSSNTAAEISAFVDRSWATLYRTAYLMTGSSDDAEDAVQEALAVVVQKWDRVGRTDDPTAYSRRIIATQAYRRARRRRLELERLVLWRRAERDASVDGADHHARRDELVAALLRLPPRMRAAVVLRFYGDLSEQEAAAVLRCSKGAVKSQSHKGLARLRELLSAVNSDGEGQS